MIFESWSEPSYNIMLGPLGPRPTASRPADIDFLTNIYIEMKFKGSILKIKMGCNNPSQALRAFVSVAQN